MLFKDLSLNLWLEIRMCFKLLIPGLKVVKKDVHRTTIEPRVDLVELGKSILRSRQKLLRPKPACQPPPKQIVSKSLLGKKDFKDFSLDLRKLFCS